MKNIYAVYDRLAQDIIGGFMLLSHDAQAVRVLIDALRDERTDIARHPEDFEVRCYGVFDPAGNLIDQYPVSAVIITATAAKASMEVPVSVA